MGPFPTSIGDDLLRWASEAGSGRWERFRDVCSYLTYKHQRDRRPWIIASELSQLGHLDIDWKGRSWSIAPPTLNLVPGLGLCLVLSGSRPHYVDERFQSATDSMDVYPFEIQQGDAPRAKFAKCASVEIAQQVAKKLGCELVVNPARQLLSVLPSIDTIQHQRASEPALDEAEYFDVETLRWNQAHNGKPGLYRLDLHGRKAHRQMDQDGNWWIVDLPVGQFLELRKVEMATLQWLPARGKQPSYLRVRRELSLPLVAERAAVISSGLVPSLDGDWRIYPNVPRDIAQQLSELLLAPISITESAIR